MTIIDPGHMYTVQNYDGDGTQSIVFLKRDARSHPDGNYPGNEGSYPGTNIQEVLRVLIDRVKYLENQIPCEENHMILANLRDSLMLLEMRASNRHGITFYSPQIAEVESLQTCVTCGHWDCNHGRV